MNLKQIKLSLAAAIILIAGMAQADERPNIIVFLVDDMGWQDTSEPFHSEITPLNKTYHTPAMTRLASEGMKFTNAYAMPVCTPTRSSLMSGMNAAHEGITNWTSPLKNRNTDARDEELGASNWNMNGLSPVAGIEKTVHATTFPQLLKDAGYFTIHTGKAHWGAQGTPGANPHQMGFIVNIAGHTAGHPQSYLGEDNYGNIPGKTQLQAVPGLNEYYGTDTFLTEALTLEAIRALETPIQNKQPFFLNMCHYALHTPIMADKRFVEKYYAAGMDSTEARYASLIEGMDKSLGDIMDYLEEKDVAQNTIIIFMSDNGGLSLAPPRGGKPFTHNLPLRAGKGSVYEGGIRVPMIVKWSGKVKPQTIAKQYVIIEDFFPTILEMAQVKDYHTVQSLDGRSFMPILENPNFTDDSRDLVWHYPHKWIGTDGPAINYFSAIRKGDWKLVYSLRTGKKELYNLKNDLGEQHDLAAKNPKKVKELSALLSERLRQWDAPMPTVKQTGKHVNYPDQVK
ncbi:MAG: sulfatase [Mangrovibacterium sp.]